MFAGLFVASLSGLGSPASGVEFGKDVRPILAKHCFTCHGPDEDARAAGLRLDTAESAREDLGGYRAIVPGDADASELIERVTSDDEFLRMPPAEDHPPLSDAEIETLRGWIDAGAKYETHWAFSRPVNPEIPEVDNAGWCRGPIDRFVLSRIEAAGESPSAEADRETLVRRVTLDLTGLAPTPEEVRRFVEDSRPDAYRRLVDRLLASPDYAERFARPWLDLARYSDTNGYEKDRPRTIWPYRDWVIDAIAADMPFDRFSIEQLAGDMLPGATPRQRIATGFHRNTMLNEEGGIDPLEYRYQAVVDRVATTGTVWMGLTTGCAQCHTHKYDPITHTDYFRLFALFNAADEPELEVPNERLAAERRRVERRIERTESELVDTRLPDWPTFEAGEIQSPVAETFATFVEAQIRGARRWHITPPSRTESTRPRLTTLDDGSVLASGDVTKRDVYRLTLELPETDAPLTAMQLEVLPHPSLPAEGPGMAYYEGRRGDFFLSELTARRGDERLALNDASHSDGKISVGSGSADAANVIDGEGSTGWSTAGAEGKANRLVVNFAEPVPGGTTLDVEMTFERHFAAALGRFRFSVSTEERPAVATALSRELTERLATVARGEAALDPETYQQLQLQFVRHHPSLADARKPIERLRDSLPEPVRTLVMRERPEGQRRETRRHHRGEYLQPEEIVEPGLPSLFAAENETGDETGDNPIDDRLALARWLASEANPLVARVTVNRAWRQFFGTGIVRTAGDFGTQSETPSHPELLDRLATDWMRHGWSMKRLHRQLVLSATYRQSIGPPPESDPGHRLLTAMPPRRLEAEVIRDAMLSASGMLSREVGGPSVHPPQPASVTAIAYGSPKWPTSVSGDRTRRSLYTFSKRTAPFAAYVTFDGPTGETCLARRDRSTTPLQALTLMNDDMYVEIASGLADTVLRKVDRGEKSYGAEGKKAEERLANGTGTHETWADETRADETRADERAGRIVDGMYRRLFARFPEPTERQAVIDFYRQSRDRLESQNEADGDADRVRNHDPARRAWTLVARALMNTDEAITTP